jgi:ATP-dependent DNA helicase PIF1
MNFSIEQQNAFERYLMGDNIFITGPGGTGKTFLINEIVRSMSVRHKTYQVCATTGCAAVLLGSGAKTIHSWCGMGIAKGSTNEIIQKIVHNKKTVGSLKKVDVLILDEVSMLSKKIFEAINAAFKLIKKSTAPFGGIQVIFTGDFFQLPPIGNDVESSQFCFESVNWFEVFPLKNHIELKHIFRQEDDIYKNILNQVRRGELDSESIAIIQTCLNKKVKDDNIPTKLFAIRSKTDFVNTRMYEKLEGDENVFNSYTSSKLKTYVESGKPIGLKDIEKCSSLSTKEIEYEIDKLNNITNRGFELKLKIGTRVMCLHNISIDDGVCNGSQGVIVNFVGEQMLPEVLFVNGYKMIIRPIWIQSDEYPCIGIGQIPLCLAWALTIHKIQGATLSIAEMDLGNSVFEYGQTYVALSRIRNLDGLYLSGFQPKRIKANPLVKEFYSHIPEIVEINLQQSLRKDNIFSGFTCCSNDIKDDNVKIIRL